MKARSGLQTPERSGLPDAVRGAGPLGADALKRSAVSMASPCPAARGTITTSVKMRILNTISPADRNRASGESRYCDIAPAAGDPAIPGNPRRAARRISRAGDAPSAPSILYGYAKERRLERPWRRRV